jgi:hypothetical protein
VAGIRYPALRSSLTRSTCFDTFLYGLHLFFEAEAGIIPQTTSGVVC